MKRFLTKSVAFIFIVFILFIFFNLPVAHAEDSNFWSVFKKWGDVGAGIVNYPLFKTYQLMFGIWNGILSLVLMLIGGIFDLSIYYSIAKFADFFKTEELISVWQLIRDTFNIVLIFLLLYVAIAQIIGAMGIKAKTTLRDIILTGFFINFSMFITRFLIDVSNKLSAVLYNKIIMNGDFDESESIAMEIIKSLKLNDFFAKDTISIIGQGNALIIQMFQTVIYCVVIWALFKVSLLLISRAVMFVFLIITSPIGFVGSSIPWINDKTQEWRKSLFNQMLVAPIFLFLLLIFIKILKIVPEILSNGGSSDSSKSPDVAAYFTFIFAIIFLVKSVKITEKYSGEAGEFLNKAIKVATTVGAIAVTGGVAAYGGAAGLATKGLTSLGTRVAGSRIGGTVLGRGLTASINGASKLTTGINTAGKFASSIVTGKRNGVSLSDDKSLVGKTANLVRTKTLGSLKDLTGKKVDIEKWQKDFSKMKKDAEESVSKLAESKGPQKSIDRKEEIEKIIGSDNSEIGGNLGNQTDQRMREDASHKLILEDRIRKSEALKDKEKIKNEKIATEKAAEKAVEIAETVLNSANLKLNNLINTRAPQKEIDSAKREVIDAENSRDDKKSQRDLAKTERETAETEYDDKKTDFNEAERIVRETRERVAKEIAAESGIDIDKLRQESEDLVTEIETKTKERNEFIKNLTEIGGVEKYLKFGITGNKDDTQKLADKLRAQKGKFKSSKDFDNNFKKFLKDNDFEIKEEK